MNLVDDIVDLCWCVGLAMEEWAGCSGGVA
jgi:hypothetical protein